MSLLQTMYFDLAEYIEILDKQVYYQLKILKQNLEGIILYGQHYPVITYGRAEKPNPNIPIRFYEVNRGGRATYHYPGQIVVYPIINLKKFKYSLKGYVETLENICKEFLLQEFSLKADTDKMATGVWVNQKKVASIGISMRKGITMHGFAINILENLAGYNYIKPCGFEASSMTSVEKLVNIKISPETLTRLTQKISNLTASILNSKLPTELLTRKL